jgi:hypothetical protein
VQKRFLLARYESDDSLYFCRKVRLYDCRNPKYFKTWGFDGEIERVMWNNFDPLYYFVRFI